MEKRKKKKRGREEKNGVDVIRRKRANKEISELLIQFKGRYSILDCLQLIRRRYPDYVLKVAIERIERKKKRDGLSLDELLEFERFKKSLS